MDAFKAKHSEIKCKMGCCKSQPNKVARKRLKDELRRDLTRSVVPARVAEENEDEK